MNIKEIVDDINELKVILRMIIDRLNADESIDIDVLNILAEELAGYSDCIQDGIDDLAMLKQ